MKIVADSSSTRTEWAIVDGDRMVEHVFTEGINPYFLTRREISHSIRLGLPPHYFRRRWEHIYFYGAGCSSTEKSKIVASSLIAQFKTPVTVESDLLGAARGLLVNRPGIACIIGTGSNSCTYDGQNIVRRVRSLGFALGDEGGGSYLGKRFVADCIKGIAPRQLAEEFFTERNLTVDDIQDAVYRGPTPNRVLSSYSTFLSAHLDNEYVYELIYDSFMNFMTRNIANYDYHSQPLSIVGATACTYAAILRKVADDFGATIATIIPRSIPGLIKFHAL